MSDNPLKDGPDHSDYERPILVVADRRWVIYDIHDSLEPLAFLQPVFYPGYLGPNFQRCSMQRLELFQLGLVLSFELV